MDQASRRAPLTWLLPRTPRPVHVITRTRSTHRAWSQLYFAGMLAQRPLVRGELLVGMRRLPGLSPYPEDPDESVPIEELRVGRYPSPRALLPLALSPAHALLAAAWLRGVGDARASLYEPRVEPESWKIVRAAWVIRGSVPDVEAVTESRPDHAELAYVAHRAAVDARLPRRARGAPRPLEGDAIALVVFSSVRLALDALRAHDPRVAPAATVELFERISLRDMLSPR